MTERALITRRGPPPVSPGAAPAGEASLDDAARLEALGLTLERSLPHGSLVRLDAADAADDAWRRVEALGYRVKHLPDIDIVELGEYRLNVRSGEGTAVPPELAVPAELADTWPHHLVQLAGPTLPEWIARIEAEGVDVAEPVSRYALFVCASPGEVARLRELTMPGEQAPFVVWTGPFHPAYRVGPELLRAKGPQKCVHVGVYPEARADEVAAGIRDAGGKVVKRWGREGAYRDRFAFLVAQIDASRIPRVARLPWVRSLHRQPRKLSSEDERSVQIVAPKLDGNPAPATGPVRAYRDVLSTLGLDGSGVVIGICDTGIDTNDDATLHRDLRGRLAFFRDVTRGKARVDVRGHGTHVAGIAAGNGGSGAVEPGDWVLGQGMAPAARVGCVNPVDTDGSPGLAPIARYTRLMVRHGAQVMNNSWGQGPAAGYSPHAALVDRLVRDPNADGCADPAADYLVLVFSAGNDGPRPGSIAEPKEAKNPIVVGSSRNRRRNADIRGLWPDSSRGPARDGRILPTVVAPGFRVVSSRTTARNPAGERSGAAFADELDALHTDHSERSGTSMAAPHVAGVCALLIQWWGSLSPGRKPSPAMLKALLVNGAEDLAGGPDGRGRRLGHVPDPDQGWGRVCLSNIVARGPKVLRDQERPFTAGGDPEHALVVRAPDPNRHLRVTLAWTDPPGPPNAARALLNDLDLEVTELDTGRVYKGNVFRGGASVPDEGKFDTVNNLECVYVERPSSGGYAVRVIASGLTASALPPFGPSAWQDYALVIDNAEEVPG